MISKRRCYRHPGRLRSQEFRLFHLAGVASLLASWLLWAQTSAAAEESPPRPNIIVLFADDLGYGDVGFNGSQEIPTPHLDELARQGKRCTDGYVSCPVCSPSRAGLLTGRYQQRFGFEFNGGSLNPKDPKPALPLTERILPDYLRAAGYATGMIGKWHLSAQPMYQPLDRGFDEFFGFLGGGHTYLPGPDDPKNRIMSGHEPVEEAEYLTDAFGRESVAFIDRHRKQPFFLYVAFNAPHVPLEATDEYLDRVSGIKRPGRRTFAAMVSALDDAVGKIVDKLKADALDQNTLIFFLSDNGALVQAGGNNHPLREGKGTTFEGGIRIPFVVTWPAMIPPGDYRQPVISLDILPTALAAAGIPLPAQLELDGVNLLPALCGESDSPPHERLYWRFGDYRAIRQGNWKLASSPTTEPALYDLSTDLSESTDLSTQQPDVMRELTAAFAEWDATLPPPSWPPGIFEKGVRRAPHGKQATSPPSQ